MDSSVELYKKNNCLSLIKLLASFQVMMKHLIRHLELPFPDVASKALFFYDGVPIFFIVSGFLIWMSSKPSIMSTTA